MEGAFKLMLAKAFVRWGEADSVEDAMSTIEDDEKELQETYEFCQEWAEYRIKQSKG
jgi:hypothetical protein